MRRRDFCVALGATAVLGAAKPARAAPVRLVVHEWEDYLSPHARDFEAFARGRGVDVQLVFKTKPDGSPDPITSADDIFMAVRSSAVDVVTPTHNYYRGDQEKLLKVLAPIDTARLSNWTLLLERLRGADYGRLEGRTFAVPLLGGSYGLAYNVDRVAMPPTSWTALWDPKLAGRISVTGAQFEANVFVAAILAGTPPANVYDVDKVDRPAVQDLLNRLIRQTHSLWDANPDVDAMAQNLDLVTDYWFGTAAVNKKGQRWRLASPREGQTVWCDNLSIAAHTQNDPAKMAAAHLLIDFMISPEVQAKIVQSFGSVPVNPAAAKHLSAAEVEGARVGDQAFFQPELLWQPMNSRTRNTYRLMWSDAIRVSGRTDLPVPK